MSMAQLCMEVPETECKLVGYTECDWDKTLKPARDDKVPPFSSSSSSSSSSSL